jgi:PAS domain-containing protein
VTPTEPLQLHHSWPLADIDQRFDLGHLLDMPAVTERLPALPSPPDATRGLWTCELAGSRLRWSEEVYRLFALPDRGVPARCATVSLYAEASRAAMERLRAHAIRHRRGFTLDVAIVPVGQRQRWLRLVAAPVCEDGRVVRLHGCKSDVSHLYRA